MSQKQARLFKTSAIIVLLTVITHWSINCEVLTVHLLASRKIRTFQTLT